MTGLYGLQKHLLKDPRLTVKERQALRHPGNIGNVAALCAEISMKLPQRLRYQDMEEDSKGNTIWPEGYDPETHTWKNRQ